MEPLVTLGIFVAGVGIGIISNSGQKEDKQPCSCQCHCAAPVANREVSYWREFLIAFLVISLLFLVASILFWWHFSAKAPAPGKGKGRKGSLGVLGAPLQLRED